MSDAIRQKPSRATETTERRRARGKHDGGLDTNLWAIEQNLDRRNYAYRWVNATAPRMTKLNRLDDWEPVAEEEVGFPVERHAEANGQTIITARLMRKKREYFEADHKARQDAIREQELSMVRGKPTEYEAGALNEGETYKPNFTNEISRS